jgi:hypothetical protein
MASDSPEPLYLRDEDALHLGLALDFHLLWAHDAGDGSLYVAGSLPDETIERLRTALGTTLKPHVRYRWFGLLGSVRDK